MSSEVEGNNESRNNSFNDPLDLKQTLCSEAFQYYNIT